MLTTTIAFVLQQTVLKDVHIPAMPLEKAIAQLATIYNSPMDISTLLKGKVILIDATQVSESEVREQIGKTLNATWEKKEGLWHLGKSNKQQAADVQRSVEMRSRFLKKTLEIRKKTLLEKPELTPISAIQMFHQLRNEEKKAQEDKNYMQPPGPSAAGYGLPNHRFLSRFLLKFGPERIAKIPNGHREVFAMHPNAMQQPMGIDITEEVAKYRAEQETWLKSAGPLMVDQDGNGSESTHIGSSQQLGYDLDASFGSMPPELQDILFSVYCSEDGAYNFKIIGIPRGESPNIIYNIKGTTYEGAFAGMEAVDFNVKPVEGFKLSQESEDFKSFFENRGTPVPATRLNPLMAKLADPIAKDLLAYGLTESMVFDARRCKRHLVALVSDNQLNTFEPVYGDMIFQGKFKSLLQDFMSVDEKWIRIFDPPFTERNLPRQDLKRLIANVRANKKVGLYDRAAIASNRPRTNSVSYVERLLDRFAATSHEDNCDPDALKLIGLLTESERSAAFGPNGVKYGQLNAQAQRHLFECCFYNEQSRVTYATISKKPPSFWFMGEPTYVLPNGIPSDANFRIETKVKEMIKDPDEPGQFRLMADAKAWGGTYYQIEHPEDYPGTNFKFDRKRKLYRLRESTYEFKLRFSPDSFWTSQMSSSDRVGTDMFTIDAFPDDLKSDFEAGYKEAAGAAKLRKNKGGGGGFTRQNMR